VRTLNLAVPIAFLLGFTFGMFVYLICAQILVSAGLVQRTAEDIGGWLALLVTAALALFLARRQVRTLGPPTGKTASGHMILFFANAAAILTTVVPIAASSIQNDPDIGHYMWFALPVFAVNLVLWPIGWARATSRA
jgi:hypothetical protein